MESNLAMKREILAVIYGDMAAILGAWKPAEGIIVDPSEGKLEVLFPEGRLSDLSELEGVVDRLKADREIELVAFFRTFDYTREDLLAAEFLWMQIKDYSGLAWVSTPPVVTTRCPECERNTSYVRADGDVIASARAEPSRQIIGCDGLILFDTKIVSHLERLGFDRGMESLPCIITLPKGGNSDRYTFVFSKVDLGPPVVGMEYGDPCPSCGRPEILANRSFRQSFARANWDGSDFCTSRFFGAGFLYVTQRVFRFLDALPPTATKDLIFEPVELV